MAYSFISSFRNDKKQSERQVLKLSSLASIIHEGQGTRSTATVPFLYCRLSSAQADLHQQKGGGESVISPFHPKFLCLCHCFYLYHHSRHMFNS